MQIHMQMPMSFSQSLHQDSRTSRLVRRVRNQDGVHCLKRRVDIKVKEEGRKGEPVRMGSETRFPPRSPGLPELTMALGTH